jgi:hypothetical protein
LKKTIDIVRFSNLIQDVDVLNIEKRPEIIEYDKEDLVTIIFLMVLFILGFFYVLIIGPINLVSVLLTMTLLFYLLSRIIAAQVKNVPRYNKEIQRKINFQRHKYILLFSLPAILALVLVIVYVNLSSHFNYDNDWIIIGIAFIVIAYAFLYANKTHKKNFVPLDLFLQPHEKVLFSSWGEFEEYHSSGHGFFYLTNMNLIFLPDIHDRFIDGRFEVFFSLKEIKMISKSRFGNTYDIITRTKAYRIHWEDEIEWKNQLQKINHIDLSRYESF